ncbi:hypothetical protein GCM10023187_31250 [Nibrella viscosa]|uniref:Glycosyltransferase subfamily 4-like N-terminal domain-containing protein n=1 Tax=Nibrella viscosa TaxID=1084524 RepID=A0ABP8KKS2_9BACT
MTSDRALTIVNRHYPPNPGITGESAWDLAKYLIEQHHIQVNIVHIDRTYAGGGQVRRPVGETYAVKTIYEGNNGLLRLVAGLLDGFLLLRKALAVRQGPLLVMTSPPMLPFWAAILLGRRIPYWLWAMDLFPEGFAAEGKVSPANFLYRWVIRKTYRHAPEWLIALGPEQAAHIRAKYQRPDLPTIVLPCGVLMHQDRDPQPPAWRTDNTKVYLGYAGNLGQPHSAEFLLSVIRHLDPQRYHLVLALYGEKADEVIRAASGQKGITLLKHIPRSQLHYLDLQLVSLLPHWTHIAVPSKAVSAVCAGSPILFYGSRESDSYVLLQEAAFLIDAARDMDGQILAFLRELTPALLATRKMAAAHVAEQLQQSVTSAYQTLARLITGNTLKIIK